MERDQIKRTLGSRFTKKPKTREEILKEIINHLEKMDKAERIDANKTKQLREKYGEQLFDVAINAVTKQRIEHQKQEAQKSPVQQMWESSLKQKGNIPTQLKPAELIEAQLNHLKKVFKGQSLNKNEINILIKHYGIEAVNKALSTLTHKNSNAKQSDFLGLLKDQLIHSEKMDKVTRIHNNEIESLKQQYGDETVNKAISKIEQRIQQDQQQQAQKLPAQQMWEPALKQKGNMPREANFIELLKDELIHSERMNRFRRIDQNTSDNLAKRHGKDMVSRAERLMDSLHSSSTTDNLIESLFNLSSTSDGVNQEQINLHRQAARSDSSNLNLNKTDKNSGQTANPNLSSTINDQSNDTSGMNEYFQQYQNM